MKKWIAIIMVVASGCATHPATHTDSDALVEQKASSNTKDSDQPPESPETLQVPLPETSIDPQVMYLLMAAELAGQRNQFAVAMDGYLQAARLVDDPRIAERAARIGLYLKDNQRTEEAVQLWLDRDADNLTARKIAVLAAFRNTDKQRAVEQLEASYKLDPAGFEALLLEVSKLMQKDGKSQFVYDVLDELAVSYPQQAVLYHVQGVLASTWRDNQLALEKNTKALELQPGWAKALVFQAQLAGREGRLSDAEGFLHKALQQSPDNARIKKMLAQAYIDGKKYDEAIAVYQALLQEKPEDGESLFAIALLNMQQKDYQLAEKKLQQLVLKPVWAAQASYYMGRLSVIRKQTSKARTWFEKVTQGPYQFDANVAIISILIDEESYAQALQKIELAEEKFPNKTLRLMLLKSDVYSRSLDHDGAFSVLSDALLTNPLSRDLLYARALVAEKLDRLDVLEADLLTILKANPHDASALNALGYTLVDRTQRYEEAAEYINKALTLKPDEAVILDSYGWLQYKLGDYQKALEYLQKAYDKYPENEIAVHLAEVLWVLGETEQATELINDAFGKTPEDEFLLDFRERYLTKDE